MHYSYPCMPFALILICEAGNVWSGRCNDVAAKGGTILILGVNRGIAVQEENGDLLLAPQRRYMEGSPASVPTV